MFWIIHSKIAFDLFKVKLEKHCPRTYVSGIRKGKCVVGLLQSLLETEQTTTFLVAASDLSWAACLTKVERRWIINRIHLPKSSLSQLELRACQEAKLLRFK